MNEPISIMTGNSPGPNAEAVMYSTKPSASPAPAERNRFARRLGMITVVALLFTGTVTFLILFGLTPLEPNQTVVLSALAANTVLALVLIALISMEVFKLLQSRRHGRAAARLHIRVVGLFALVATIPAILVAIVASISLDLGLDRWFEQRTKAIVNESVSVAEAYVEEHSRSHVQATVSMASELDAARREYGLDRRAFQERFNLQTRGRGMILAQLLAEDRSVILEARISEDANIPDVPPESFEAAKEGDLIFIPRGQTNLVGAVLKMRQIPKAYLFTVRPLNDEVVASIRRMQENTSEYIDLENSQLRVQLTFAVLYLAVALMILLSAIWMGISVADRFVRPIRRLINAADEISGGNLDVYVDTKHTEGDFKNLGDTFNTMTTELKQQRSQLLQANTDIDRRARFTEAVLSGVTAAVIGVDPEGRIQIANSTTSAILGLQPKRDVLLSEAFPVLGEVLANAREAGKPEYREQATMMVEGQSRTLNAQVTQERDASKDHSFVITIDDITDLVVAQRSTAWSDVARRIAHEIKNPLTPIQLSAERIRKRYSKYITEDKEVFDQCTDTIVRQVGDIGRMVDEFSSFARMPKPEMALGDLLKTVQEALFTQKVANPDITFDLDIQSNDNIAEFDQRLLSQALINVIKNAVEAIEALENSDQKATDENGQGRVEVRVWQDSSMIVIDVIDNGKGLPEEDRQKLLEPYMTTRQKGTGLGLAIVRKILEDHGGTIELMDAPSVETGGRGAMMRLRLPLVDRGEESESTEPAGDTIGRLEDTSDQNETPETLSETTSR